MNKKLAKLLYFTVLLSFPVVAFADSSTFFNDILTRTLNYIVWPIFGGVAVIMLIYAGFLFATAQGDPAKITTAKKAVLWVAVGIAVGLLAFLAVGTIKKIIYG